MASVERFYQMILKGLRREAPRIKFSSRVEPVGLFLSLSLNPQSLHWFCFFTK